MIAYYVDQIIASSIALPFIDHDLTERITCLIILTLIFISTCDVFLHYLLKRKEVFTSGILSLVYFLAIHTWPHLGDSLYKSILRLSI